VIEATAAISTFFGSVRIFCSFLFVSKQLEDQHNIVQQLEEGNEKLNHKIYKLEKQLLAQNKPTTGEDHEGCTDEVWVHVKHQVT